MTRAWPIAVLVLGVASAAAFQAFPFVADVADAAAFRAALAGFQQAENTQALCAIFRGGEGCAHLVNERIVQEQTAANWFDLLAFIPSYTLFLLAVAAFTAGGARRFLFWLAAAPALVACAADASETITQLYMLRLMPSAWDEAVGMQPFVHAAAWTKYYSLGVAAFGVAAICVLAPRKRWLLGVLSLVPVAFLFVFIYAREVLPDVVRSPIIGLGALWIGAMAAALTDLFRAKDGSP